MPAMVYTPKTYNDVSALSPGWKPAFLLEMADEETPSHFKMADNSPRMWRWRFAVYEVDTLIGRQPAERQSAITSQKFGPARTLANGTPVQAARAYEWSEALLGRSIVPGEIVNLDPLMPLPCRVYVERKDQYANLKHLTGAPELAQYLTPEFRQYLAQFLLTFTNGPDVQPDAGVRQPPISPVPPAPPAPPDRSPGQAQVQPPAPAPGMQQWGRPATPTTPAWPSTTTTPATTGSTPRI